MTSQEFLENLDKTEGTSWSDTSTGICKALDDFSKQQNAEYIEALRGTYNQAIEDAIKHFKENDTNQFRFIITALESLKK